MAKNTSAKSAKATKNEVETNKASLKTGTKIKGAGKAVAAKKAPAKAAKKAPAAEGSARAGRAPAYPAESKIKVLVAENPKREGTASYDRFALYGKGTTVGAFLEAGGTSGDLRWDVAHEYISIG